MRILFINNDGGGFADHVEVPAGTTIAMFVEERLPYGRPSDYLIRVNRQPTPPDYVLQEGDRVSCTPTKIEGAIAAAACIRSPHSPMKGASWEPGNGSIACT